MGAISAYAAAPITKTAESFVRQKLTSGPFEAKEFFRKFSHACRDLAFEIEAGTFVWKIGWASKNGEADGISGHILVRSGMPADFAGESLVPLFFEMGLDDLCSVLYGIEQYCNMTYVLEENKPIQKERIVRYLREASDMAGRMAAA